MIQRTRCILAAAFVCTMAATAHAQQPSSSTGRASARDVARDLGDKGFEAMDRGDWRAALAFFRRADASFHASTLLLGIARAEAQLGQLVEATEHYQRILDEGPFPEASRVIVKSVEAAKREIGPVKARCARIVVRVVTPAAPPAMVLTLDDATLPSDALGSERLLNPGTHRVALRADGYRPAEISLTLAEAEWRDVPLSLVRETPPAEAAATPVSPQPLAPAPREKDGQGTGTQRTLGLVALGVGGAGLLTGAVTGIMAIGAKSSLSGSACASGCDRAALDAYEDDRSRYQTTGAIATVGFTVAIAGGVAGAILLLTAPRSRPSSRAAIVPYVDAGGVGAVGRF